MTFGTPFTGVLDGRGHAITNLTGALFTDVTNPGEILDLVVSDDVDASMQSTGWGLLARANSGTMSSYGGFAFGGVWKMDAALSPYPSLAFEAP